MSEWWTYRPSDFLMFSPRIYWRLFESLNAAVWPAQPLIAAAVVAALLAAARTPRARLGGRGGTAAAAAVALALAAAWAHVGWAFVWQRYAPINWAARDAAYAFGLQALLLGAGAAALAASPARRRGAVAAVGPARPAPVPSLWRARVGAALVAWAAVGHPLLAPLAGRPWAQAEVLGLAPDPTAIATLGALLLVGAPSTPLRRLLLRGSSIVPLAVCVAGAATLATMGATAQGATVAAAAAAAVAAAVATRRPAPPD